jgi:hypothetical protein
MIQALLEQCIAAVLDAKGTGVREGRGSELREIALGQTILEISDKVMRLSETKRRSQEKAKDLQKLHVVLGRCKNTAGVKAVPAWQ